MGVVGGVILILGVDGVMIACVLVGDCGVGRGRTMGVHIIWICMWLGGGVTMIQH